MLKKNYRVEPPRRGAYRQLLKATGGWVRGLTAQSILQIAALAVTMAATGRRMLLDHSTGIVGGSPRLVPFRAFKPKFWFDPCSFGRIDPVDCPNCTRMHR